MLGTGGALVAAIKKPAHREKYIITWANVDFEKDRLHVRSPKIENHAGYNEAIAHLYRSKAHPGLANKKRPRIRPGTQS